jgi:hypothetical protein
MTCSATQHDDSSDERHELLRDAMEEAVRSAIKRIDQSQFRNGGAHYTFSEVNWVLAHVVHDLLRFGPLNEEPTSWVDVEEFVRKLRLTNLDHRCARTGRPPWVPLTYSPTLNDRPTPWFYAP